MKVTLIRHTRLQVAQGVCYGQSDVDIASTFVQELALIRQKLSHWQFDAVFTSPLQRCAKLAQALAPDAIRHDARLKELHFGDWEMQAWADIPRDVFDVWAQNYATLSPPNGETFSELQGRGVAFLSEMQAQFPQGHIVVVTHGGMIRTLLAHTLNMPLKGLFRFTIDYGSLTQLDFCQTIPKIQFVNH